MAKCQFCDKDVAFGIKVSHSHRRSNRTWKPNVKRVKAIVDGSPKHVQRQGHPRCVIEHDPIEACRFVRRAFFGFVWIAAARGKALARRRAVLYNRTRVFQKQERSRGHESAVLRIAEH